MTTYNGWKIFIDMKVGHSREPDYKHKLKSIFNQGEWSFEDNDRTLIHNLSFDSPIEVLFPEETTEEEKSMGLHKYRCVIKSDFFSWGSRSEYLHRQLCHKVYHKIAGKKEAYFLKDSELIPLRKKRILKMKKSRNR